MKSVKGVVMRVGKKTITVYTREGEFTEIPFPDNMPAVGQVIDVSQKPGPRTKWNLLAYAAVAAALVLAVALGILGMPGGPVSAAAYVALDINPSVQLYIDKDLRVIKARALNDEAREVLSPVEVKGQDVYQAVDLIVREAHSQGYINKEEKNIILACVVPLGNPASLVDNNKIRDTIYNEMKDRQMPGFVVVNNVMEDVEKNAEKAGLSVNKYLVYDRMNREGLQVTTEDFRSHSVTQVVESTGARIDKLFSSESCEVQWEIPSGSQPSTDDADGQPDSGHYGGHEGDGKHSTPGQLSGTPASGVQPGTVWQPQGTEAEHKDGMQINGTTTVVNPPPVSGEHQGKTGGDTLEEPSAGTGHSSKEEGSGDIGH